VGRPAVARAARLPGPPAPGRPGPGAGHLARPLYEFTGQLASFSPPTAEQQALFAAVAADQAETDRFFGVMTGAAYHPLVVQPPGIPRSPRRRPSGRPPPLPRHLRTTGVGWLIAAGVLAAASVAAFAGGWRGLGLAVTVAEAALAGWLAGLDAPGLLGAMRALDALGSWTAITVLLWGLLGALLVFRRLRQLLVVLGAWMAQGFLVQ
jgi:nicotinamidase-related amidase